MKLRPKLSSSGPGHLQVNSQGLNLKVCLKSLRKLDRDLLAIISMPPPVPTNPLTKRNRKSFEEFGEVGRT